MCKNHFVIGIVLGMSLAVSARNVEAKEAKEKQFHASFAGTDTYKDDFRFTEPSGVDYIVATGKSTLGEYMVQAVEEFQPDGNKCTPPGGGSGGVALVGTAAVYVLSFPERGENLFLHFSPDVTSYACLNLETIVASVQSTFVVSGGTGRFEGATGTISQTHLFIGLPPPPARGGIGSFTGTFDGTINFAK